MPELISIEDDQITRLRDELKMPGGFHRVILKQVANQFALRRLIDQSHENGITRPLVVRRVVVKPDVVPRLRIVVERTGMGIVLGTETEFGLHQTAQEFDEGAGSIQIEKTRGLLDDRVVTHAPALFVAG